MQIAQIVPKVHTQKEAIFDYAIPPEILPQMKIGLLVLIPFHGRKLEGIVVAIKRISAIKNLKPIISVIDPTPVIDDIHFKLAQWMANYYLAPLGKTLFENIVPPAKKILKKRFLAKEELPINKPDKFPTLTARASKVGKYLIVGEFPKRLNFYLKAIRKTLVSNKQVIILVPDLSLIPHFRELFKNSYALLHSNLTKTQRFVEWDKIRRNKVQIIIGSNSALFAPAKNLGLVIIDQEENETYKNDRSPRFHAVEAAEILTKLAGANLILGSLVPQITTYFKALKRGYLLKKSLRQRKPKIKIVNFFHHQVISPPLRESVEENLQKKGRAILVLNKKGEGSKFSCLDCSWIMFCPTCGLPAVFQNNQLKCLRCKKDLPTPDQCPKCQGVHLKPSGLGTTKLEKFLKDFWPHLRIIRLEESSTDNPQKGPWDIAISTVYGLKFTFPKINLVAIIDADQALNFPDFHTQEKNFRSLYKFLCVGEEGIIQTNFPESPFIAALGQLSYESFFLDELANRQKFALPPFFQLVRLIYKNQDEEKCRQNTTAVFENLKNSIKKNPSLVLFPAAAAFFKKIRGFYRFEIIIKFRKKLPQDFEDKLRSLPTGWRIDRDPNDLL